MRFYYGTTAYGLFFKYIGRLCSGGCYFTSRGGELLSSGMPSTKITDTAYGMRYLTYLTQELPTLCQPFFKGMSEKREETFVAGLSMGAMGPPLRQPFLHLRHSAPPAAGGDAFLERYLFGDALHIDNSSNDLLWLAKQCLNDGRPLPRLFQWCGTEDFLYQDNLAAS